jgi:hypothetical protein
MYSGVSVAVVSVCLLCGVDFQAAGGMKCRRFEKAA